MSATTRSVDEQSNRATTALRGELAPFWSAYSKPLRLTFPDMNVQREVQHGMSAIPDGFIVVYADADVIAEPGVLWSTTLAYLRAGAVNAQAVVIFYTVREDITDA